MSNLIMMHWLYASVNNALYVSSASENTCGGNYKSVRRSSLSARQTTNLKTLFASVFVDVLLAEDSQILIRVQTDEHRANGGLLLGSS